MGFLCRTASLRWLHRAAASLGIAGWLFPADASIRRVPTDDGEVIAEVRVRTATADEREADSLRLAVRAAPRDAATVARWVRRCLECDRQDSDPRWLGWAQAALVPWNGSLEVPEDLRLARALWLQRRHEFDAALADLDLVIRQNPRCAEAWLVRSTLLALRGDLDAARSAVAPLWRLVDPLTATTATATVASLSGAGERSCALLERLLNAKSTSPPMKAQEVWAWTQLAETRERLGQMAAAEMAFRRALRADSNDSYLLGAFADFLLRQHRAAEAERLVENHSTRDALVLRWLEARLQLRRTDGSFETAKRKLAATFELQAARGERVHLREAGRFRLRVAADPVGALRLARENWQIQREPADLLLLQEAANAAGSESDQHTVREWVKRTRLEDVRLGLGVTTPS